MAATSGRPSSTAAEAGCSWDLRFAEPKHEEAFRRSLEPQVLRTSIFLACFWIVVSGTLLLEASAKFGHALTHSGGLVSAFVYAVCGSFRLCGKCFRNFNWELTTLLLVAFMVVQATAIGLEPLPFGSSQALSRSLNSGTLLALFGPCIPVRSVMGWALPVLAVLAGFTKLALMVIIDDRVDLGLFADIAVLGWIGLISQYGSWLRERHTRSTWVLHDVEDILSAVQQREVYDEMDDCFSAVVAGDAFHSGKEPSMDSDIPARTGSAAISNMGPLVGGMQAWSSCVAQRTARTGRAVDLEAGSLAIPSEISFALSGQTGSSLVKSQPDGKAVSSEGKAASHSGQAAASHSGQATSSDQHLLPPLELPELPPVPRHESTAAVQMVKSTTSMSCGSDYSEVLVLHEPTGKPFAPELYETEGTVDAEHSRSVSRTPQSDPAYVQAALASSRAVAEAVGVAALVALEQERERQAARLVLERHLGARQALQEWRHIRRVAAMLLKQQQQQQQQQPRRRSPRRWTHRLPSAASALGEVGSPFTTLRSLTPCRSWAAGSWPASSLPTSAVLSPSSSFAPCPGLDAAASPVVQRRCTSLPTIVQGLYVNTTSLTTPVQEEVGLNGLWLLAAVGARPSKDLPDPWLYRLEINGKVVADAQGTVRRFSEKNGQVLLEGGVMLLRGERLFRVGKADACLEYRRASRVDPDNEDGEGSEAGADIEGTEHPAGAPGGGPCSPEYASNMDDESANGEHHLNELLKELQEQPLQ